MVGELNLLEATQIRERLSIFFENQLMSWTQIFSKEDE